MDKVRNGERYIPAALSRFLKQSLTFVGGNKPGPDRATTTVGEDLTFSLRAGGKVSVFDSDRGHGGNLLTRSSAHRRGGANARRQDPQAAHPKFRWRKGRLSSLQGEPLHSKMSIQRQSPDPQRDWYRYVANWQQKNVRSTIYNKCRNPPIPRRCSPGRRSVDFEHRWQIYSAKHAWCRRW